jgi:hypothetical protein
MISETIITLPDYVAEFRIRDSYMWARMQSDCLVHARLTPEPSFESFQQVQKVELMSVSPRGDFCFVRCRSGHYLISAEDLRIQEAKLLPRAVALWGDWVHISKYPKPFLFVDVVQRDGTQLILQYNLNVATLIQCAVLPENLIAFPAKLRAIHLFQFKDGLYGLAAITDKKIYPYILGEDFMKLGDHGQEIQLPGEARFIYCESTVIGFTFAEHIFAIVIDRGLLQAVPLKFLERQLFYSCAGALGLSATDTFMFKFAKGEVEIFDLQRDALVECLRVPGAELFDMDLVRGELYSISGRTVTRHLFQREETVDPIDPLRLWLFRKFLAAGNHGEAVDMLLRTKVSIHEMCNLCENESAEMRLHLFKGLLKLQGIDQRIRASLAYLAFDLYARLESDKPDPNCRDFANWTAALISGGLLTDKIARGTLALYNWEKPLHSMTKPKYLFALSMAAGDHTAALSYLERVDNPKRFVILALRLLKANPEAVVAMLKQRKLPLASNMLPIIMMHQSGDYIESLFQRPDPPPWIRDMFALWLANSPGSRDAVLNYMRRIPTFDRQAVTIFARSLIQAGRFNELTAGLALRREFYLAAGVAARGGPTSDFNFIPETDGDMDLRKRCTSRVLTSMRPPDAAVVAEQLLRSNRSPEIGSLIEYLPESTKVADLRTTIAKYATRKQKIGQTQKEQLNNALTGITVARELKKQVAERGLTFHGCAACAKCGRAALVEPGIVYPCSHVLHQSCVAAMLERVALDPKLAARSCPLCGILAIEMIDHPFVPAKTDCWSMDPAEHEKGGSVTFVSALAGLF